jgi:hypothetical protein
MPDLQNTLDAAASQTMVSPELELKRIMEQRSKMQQQLVAENRAQLQRAMQMRPTDFTPAAQFVDVATGSTNLAQTTKPLLTPSQKESLVQGYQQMLNQTQMGALEGELDALKVGAQRGRILTPGSVEKISDYEAGMGMLENLQKDIESNKQMYGPLKGRMSKIKAIFGDQASTTALAQVEKVKQFVGKALEGGVLRKEDTEKYNKILGSIEKDPDALTEILGILGQDLGRNKNIYVKNLSRAGYNLGGFELSPEEAPKEMAKEEKEKKPDFSSWSEEQLAQYLGE